MRLLFVYVFLVLFTLNTCIATELELSDIIKTAREAETAKYKNENLADKNVQTIENTAKNNASQQNIAENNDSQRTLQFQQ